MIRTFPFVALLLAAPLFADGPADNVADNVRRVPPPGVAIPDADRQELQAGADALGKEISELRTSLKGKPALLDLLPDVQIFHKAVDWALRYNEFYDVKEVAVAKQQLQLGMERAKALRDGKPSWPARTGLVVRGYVSKIDGSVQPYGLVVPPTYKPDYPHKYRLDFWCHGRGEKLTELSFIQGRLNSPGEFTPPNAFVLHLYGRYCNANKFAGEVDLFEAYESVKKQYPIDEHRLVIRGFSMGGAACWQFAVHYPSFFAAAAPGAGFSETADFLKVFQKESLQPTWYEQRLWRWYDCTDYAINLTNLPTVAYSGEIDSQKQAADMMTAALAKEGVELTHIIGPKTGHAYHPDAKKEINRRIDGIVERGRNTVPQRVRFTTWTLRYNQAFWVTIDGFEDVIVSRRQPRIDARLQPGVGADGRPTHVHVNTQNVSAFTLSLSPGLCPLDPAQRPRVSFLELGSRPVPGGEEVQAAPVLSDRSWVAHFRKFGGHWQAVESADDGALAKRHGLQGPIDDAFLDHFIIVKPTGTPMHEATGKWVEAEMAHAVEHWRRQFRGEAIVKADSEITDADIVASNLVLWGDPASNKILAKIIGKLPLTWNSKEFRLGERELDPGRHVAVMIYPNPLNTKKYVVLNSGFTFREYDYLNNARQVPKLPDYALIDVSVPADARKPGGIVAAGFFDEQWKLPPHTLK